MRFKSIVVLTAVLAVLGAAYWLTQRSQQQARVEEEASKKLFTAQASDIEKITIARPDEKPTTARREQGAWTIVEPYAVTANAARLNRVAETLTGLASDRTLDVDPANLGEYGLDQPRLKVSFTAAGKEHALEFGGISPTQDHRYARLDGGPVLLVRQEAIPELDLPLQELRNRAMVDVGPAGVNRFEFAWIATDGPDKGKESVSVVVEKRDDGRWHMAKPVEGAADQDIVGNVAAMLALMPGRDYVDAPEALADYGLDPPRARITAWTGPESKGQVVYVGGLAKTGEQDGIYVKRADAPAVFVVEPGFAQHFPQSPDTFLAKTLLTHSAADIGKIQYRAGDVEIVLENDEKLGWRMTQPATDQTDQEEVSRFLSALKAVSVKEFLGGSPDPAQLEPATVKVDLTLKNGKTVSLAVGKPMDGGGHYAVQDTGMAVRVDAGDVQLVLVKPFYFKNKLIFELPEGKISRLVLNLEGLRYVFEFSGTDWLVREPANKRWESQSDMQVLLKAIGRVEALDVEPAGGDPARYGLNAPVLTVEASGLGEPEKTYGPLSIGYSCEDDSQERYAAVAGRTEVFRVSQSILDRVREALKGVRDSR